jgi:hypothetical protein
VSSRPSSSNRARPSPRPPPSPNNKHQNSACKKDGALVTWHDRTVAQAAHMISLGFGKFARSDRIYALEPLVGEDRGDGRRTKVWVDGIADPIIASRTEVTILRDMGQEAVAIAPTLDEALDLARRLAAAAEAGRVDLNDLGRRARRVLASTTEE